MMNTKQSLLFQGLVGYWSRTGHLQDEEADLSAMVSALNCGIELRSHRLDHCAFGSTGATASNESGSSFVIVGSPYWADPQLQSVADGQSHAQALQEAYREHGINCLDLLKGAFSFAIVDGQSKALHAGVDRLGQFPLYYCETDSGVVLGSSAGSVLAHGGVETELTDQGIYNYMYFHMIPSPTSIYRNLHKLPAAHYLKCDNTGLSTFSYWQPDYSRKSAASFGALKDQFLDALKSSVSRAADGAGNIAAFLSGGLDSSTVTGMLAEINGGSTEAYSIGFDAQGYDEMAFARITAKHFGVKLNEHYVTPDEIVDALPRIATSYDEPFGNSSALPAWFCARFAADNGVSRLLAGDGGDELFAGNERYATQRIFELYGDVPQLLRSSLIEPLVSHLPRNFPLASKARGYIQQANTQLPERLQHYNFLHMHDAGEIFSDELMANVDSQLPLRLQRAIYNLPHNATTLDRMLFLDWQYTLADNDLRKVSHTTALAGVEVAYPMLDDALIEMSLRVPDSLKMKRGRLRHFFKEALRGWLPLETINKSKHGFGLPFGVWMRTHSRLQQMAYDSLLQLKTRRYFKPEFIDSTIELHRNSHASYYGELIWVLMTLELWLQRDQ